MSKALSARFSSRAEVRDGGEIWRDEGYASEESCNDKAIGIRQTPALRAINGAGNALG